MADLISLDLAALADIIGDETRPSLARPWHDDALDRDIITNGRAMLIWDGHAFAPHPDKPPDIAAYVEQMQVLGRTTLGALREWIGDDDTCEMCMGPIVMRCGHCGAFDQSDRPGRFAGTVFNRTLLATFLRPLRWQGRDTPVEIRGSGRKREVVQIVAERWMVVIMPMHEERVSKVVGEPFVMEPPAP